VRKTVYRLTHEGWVQAMKLRTRFQGDIVEVLAPSLDPTPMRVSEIPEIFPAYVNLTAAVSLVRGGRLDFTRLHGIGSGAVAPVLLVLDNFQRAAPELARFIAGPVVDLGAKASAKILLISRTNPAALVRRKGSNGFRVEVLRVGGLDHTASVGLLRSKGFAGDDTALERAASSARGHPILLSFAAQTGSSVTGEMTRYLEREIWRTLTKDERTVLEAS